MTGIALAALATLLYTYAGYPLLALAWARALPRAVRKRTDFEPTVSVCLAVYDGEKLLERKLRSLRALDYPAHKLEFLICSDGSSDGTAELARKLAQGDPRIRVLSNPTRLGKPASLNRLRSAARGDVLLMTDVRQTLNPKSLRALLEFLADPEVGCVSGSLVLSGDTGAGAYWRYERFIRGSEARIGAMVGVSGSLYAIRREDLGELPNDVLLDDMFVPLRVALAKRRRIVLCDDAEAYDDACDDEREFSRKVRTLAGNYQLVAMLPALVVPGKSPVWFQIVSHKLLRLVCPWALVVVFVTSLLLAFDSELPPVELAFFRTLALAQTGFYVLAALGARAGRLGALARTFVLLNAAALVGLWRVARGTQSVTW
jgi:cellulose synthase/poly-beta-1,6-N-acetylglucosamine synthase-like glycosyltransferase